LVKLNEKQTVDESFAVYGIMLSGEKIFIYKTIRFFIFSKFGHPVCIFIDK